MDTTSFNLRQTLELIGRALEGVFCHMLFDIALHGFVLSVILLLIAVLLFSRKNEYANVVLAVAKRVTACCLLLAAPGLVFLIASRRLPDAGVFNFNSIGILSCWSLLSVHLVFVEINKALTLKSQSKLKAGSEPQVGETI